MFNTRAFMALLAVLSTSPAIAWNTLPSGHSHVAPPIDYDYRSPVAPLTIDPVDLTQYRWTPPGAAVLQDNFEAGAERVTITNPRGQDEQVQATMEWLRTGTVD
jgi:hypothetical protein